MKNQQLKVSEEENKDQGNACSEKIQEYLKNTVINRVKPQKLKFLNYIIKYSNHLCISNKIKDMRRTAWDSNNHSLLVLPP